MKKRINDLPFLEHLEELRGRIIKSVVAVVITSCFFYPHVERVLAWFIRPVGRLYYLAPAEAFVAHVTVLVLGGVLLASPYVFYQFWAFISGALTAAERRYVYLFGPVSMVLFLAGITFAYLVVAPFALRFLLGFSSQVMIPMITASQYISFVGTLSLGFGLVFEMPLIIVFLTRVGIATPEFLKQMRRHAIVLIFVMSAFLTPPDCASQFMMAVPMLALYEISIIFSSITYRLRNKAE